MPIGLGTAIIGASVVAGGAGIYASSKTASAAKSTAASNNALQQDIYTQNKQALSPYTGSRAQNYNDAIDAFLGVGPGASSPTAGANWNGYLQAYPDLQKAFAQNKAQGSTETADAFAQRHYLEHGQAEGRAVPGTQTALGPDGSTSGSALGGPGFKNYLNSTGFQFGLQTGSDAITSNAATRGLLRSGSTLKALDKFGQGYGQTFAQNYVNNLQRQSDQGLTAASALAGVGQNYANSVSNNNNNALSATAGANASVANSITGVVNNGVSALALAQGLGKSSSYAPALGKAPVDYWGG